MSFSLFARYGVELEYMIVRADDLSVVPWSDRVLVDALGGSPVSDVERGDITWSNELAAHVIELKTSEPVPDLGTLSQSFAREVREINRRLAAHGARLLPTAMHPLMRPEEARLWAHEYNEIYAAFDRIFDCRGHGWSNLQSVHINLPFDGDKEFARLHAAIRLVLPLLSALAAASPLQEGRFTPWLDTRLAHYRSNSAKLPALCGQVIPEPVYSEADYERTIFSAIRAQLAPHDPEGVLRAEFSNSRGAIARFERGSIEIRLLDIQECPAADFAIAKTVVALLKALVAETHLGLSAQKAVPTELLARVFNRCVETGERTRIDDKVLLRAFGCDAHGPVSAHALWAGMIERLNPLADAPAAEKAAQSVYLAQGPLARRITRALPAEPDAIEVRAVYATLAGCLENNRSFEAKP